MKRDGKEVVKRLQAEGWSFVSQKGSHAKFRKNGQTIIVPHPKKRLPTGTARSIGRVTGLI